MRFADVSVLLVSAIADLQGSACGGGDCGFISTIGSLGGFAAQNLMPWVASLSGSALAAMSVPALSLGLLAASAFAMLRHGTSHRRRTVRSEVTVAAAAARRQAVS